MNCECVCTCKAPPELTKRELEVFKQLVLGLRGKAIAEKLFIEHKTLKFHANNIYRKCKVKGKLELARKFYALELPEQISEQVLFLDWKST